MSKNKKVKIRRAWKINPVTRIKKDNKKYDRKKIKSETKALLEKDL
jgi:hypothetical protein